MSKLKLINLLKNHILEHNPFSRYNDPIDADDPEYGKTYTHDLESNKPSEVGFKKYDLETLWPNMCTTIIDNLEGGYFFKPANYEHENKCMNHTNPVSEYSTETMFGIDREMGNWDSNSKGKEFWNLIDAEKEKYGAKKTGSNPPYLWTKLDKFCKTWVRYYRGGSLEPTLRERACNMMKDSMYRNMKIFDSSEETKKIILSSKKLIFHFFYASFNGSWFFKNWALEMIEKVNGGAKLDDLVSLAKSQRLGSALYNQDKVIKIIDSLE